MKKKQFTLDEKIDKLSSEFFSMDRRQDRMFDNLLEIRRTLKKITEQMNQFSKTQDTILGLFSNREDHKREFVGETREKKLAKLKRIHHFIELAQAARDKT